MLQAPLPEVPVEVGVALHWLAVDGRQVRSDRTLCLVSLPWLS